MKLFDFKSWFLVALILLSFSTISCADSKSDSEKKAVSQTEKAQAEPKAAPSATSTAVEKEAAPAAETPKKAEDSKSLLIADFESDPPEYNNLGAQIGAWNLNPTDINNSYCDNDPIKVVGLDGQETTVMQLTYSVNSELPSQNGLWLKLSDLDAQAYDHLEFDIKGDAKYGFTEKMKVEIKKCKELPCKGTDDETLKGSYSVDVTGEWQTISIPLNKMTGILDFADPAVWKDPSVGRRNLDEIVFIFQDRQVTKKEGRVWIDNVRMVNNENPGPTAVDFPPRHKEKTPTKIEGLEFQQFLMNRLQGFPTQTYLEKKFPQDDKEFLKEIAKDTWNFFDHIVDKEHGLPLDTVQIGSPNARADDVWVGDYTNVTNIGVYLMCLVSAYDFGFIDKAEAVKRLQLTMTTLEKLEYHKSGFPYNYYDTTTAERTSYFVSLVDSGWLVIGLQVVKYAFPEELSAQADRLISRGKFSFFYDSVERQMFHGYYDHLEVYSDYHYGVFYTEPRATSFLAIAKGDVPMEHWFEGLIRTFPAEYKWQTQKPIYRVQRTTLGHTYTGGYYEWKNLKYIPSWGGSAFEALMPTMVMKEKEVAPRGLGANNHSHVMGQIHYALDELKMPVWGMSPSTVPEGGYSEYGAAPFGSKGYKAGVVTPHASILSVEYAPQEVVANLRKLIESYKIYGEYGFYDAVTPATGLVARKYLSLDQGMIFVALNNYLNDGAIRKRFHADPQIKEAEGVLSEESFFDKAPESDDDATPNDENVDVDIRLKEPTP